MNATALTPELDALVSVARTLPPELVRQVADFAEFLGRKRAAPPVDVSDEWSEEDLRDFARASAVGADRFPPAS
jgi:hypothetical protein